MIAALVSLALTMSQDRVEVARSNKEAGLVSLCRSIGLAGLPKRLYLRAFKEEKVLEAWGYEPGRKQYILIRKYPIAKMSGTLGPKRAQGDAQVPEGFYKINSFNPHSQYHLSLRVSYPNAADLANTDAADPGGDIYIHGNRVSIGCLAMTDDLIEEIYLLALAAKSNPISLHIFPARLTRAKLARVSTQFPVHAPLWRSMKPMFDEFEKHRRVLPVRVEKDGSYKLVAPRT